MQPHQGQPPPPPSRPAQVLLTGHNALNPIAFDIALDVVEGVGLRCHPPGQAYWPGCPQDAQGFVLIEGLDVRLPPHAPDPPLQGASVDLTCVAGGRPNDRLDLLTHAQQDLRSVAPSAPPQGTHWEGQGPQRRPQGAVTIGYQCH